MSGHSREDDFLSALRSEIVRAVCRGTGIAEPEAMPVATEIIASVSERWQGEVYIAKPRPADSEILEAFNGANRREVCRRFGISKGTFYRALRRARLNEG